MQVVADAVGVSRQTVHNEFVTKQGLARALVFATTSAYLDQEEQIVRHSHDLRAALHDTVLRTLELAADDRFIKTVISADGSATFLPLYTSEGGPLITFISDRMAGAFAARWPTLEPVSLRISTEAITRQLISHIMLPTHPREQVAEQIADMYSRHLEPPTRVSESKRDPSPKAEENPS
jgi:AcrR family transcriptional regulator